MIIGADKNLIVSCLYWLDDTSRYLVYFHLFGQCVSMPILYSYSATWRLEGQQLAPSYRNQIPGISLTHGVTVIITQTKSQLGYHIRYISFRNKWMSWRHMRLPETFRKTLKLQHQSWKPQAHPETISFNVLNRQRRLKTNVDLWRILVLIDFSFLFFSFGLFHWNKLKFCQKMQSLCVGGSPLFHNKQF